MSDRQRDFTRFYDLMAQLEQRLGGTRCLGDCLASSGWPKRGVYFFFEPSEVRANDKGPRVVRVGTHALKFGATSTLWKRLRQHKGTAKTGGGDHRGSIFRKLVGHALLERDSLAFPTWGHGSSAPRSVRLAEGPHEQRVSEAIHAMPFLWLCIDDEPGPDSMRGFIERNSIALLSNWKKHAIDAPSTDWLGHHCAKERVRQSGLWNQNHVDGAQEASFLTELEELVK